MKPVKHHLSSRFLAASLLLCGPVLAAQPVTIIHAGFEDPVVANEGAFTATATGWSKVNSATEIGVLNPATADFTAQAPEGANVGYVFGGVPDAGMSQILTATLQADSSYSLSVKVGNSLTYAYDGYRIQLLAGGTVLAEDNNTLSPAQDTFVTATVNYTYNAGLHAALVGQALEIRLLGMGQSGDVEGETEFDEVQLAVALGNPLAAPGGPYTIPTSGSLSLNGNASLPSDGQAITTYEWDLDNDGDFSEAVTGATPAAIAYANLQSNYNMIVGANPIKLRVTDSAAKTSTTVGSVTLLPVIPIGDRWWDGPNTSGVTDGASQGGTATWDTGTANWDPGAGYAGPIPWINSDNDNAIFGGTAGTVTVAEPISLKDLTFNLAGSYTIDGGALNFAPGSAIRTSDNRYDQTITSAITGSPAVETKDFGMGNQYKGFVFAPASGTQTLGAVLNPNNTGNTDKAGVTFAGSTTGNSIASIGYAGGDRYADTNFQSGGWTIAGNITTGTVKVTGGTHTLSGTVRTDYNEVRITGGTVKGTFTIFTNDRRGAPYLSGTGTISPGNSIGTITLDWGTGGTPAVGIDDYAFSLRTGSTYEWEVGAANTTDKIHLVEGRLYLQNFTLKILAAGGNPAAIDQLPVFTYATGVTRDLTGFPNLPANFILPAGWSGTPSLVDDGNGTIYLTGVSNTGTGNTFANWIATYPGVGAFSGVGDDADGDGSDNGVENFFGTNPSVSSSGLVAGAVGVNTFIFTHPQNATPASDLTAVYQWSKDLASFHASGVSDGSSTVTFTTQANTPLPGTTTVTATVTGTATPKLFVNIKVTQP